MIRWETGVRAVDKMNDKKKLEEICKNE